MGLRLIQTRLSGKRTFVLFRNDPFLPVFVPFIYLVLKLKNKARSTSKGHLIGIQRLYEFFENELKLDLDELLLKGQFSTISARIDQFVYWLTYSNSISGIRSRQIYLGAVNDYFKWAFSRYNKKNSGSAPVLNSQIRSFIRNVAQPTNADKALTEEELSLVRSYSLPDGSNNPFKERNRLRNFLIIEIFVWAGLRLGELAKLKATDVLEFNARYYLQVEIPSKLITSFRGKVTT